MKKENNKFVVLSLPQSASRSDIQQEGDTLPNDLDLDKAIYFWFNQKRSELMFLGLSCIRKPVNLLNIFVMLMLVHIQIQKQVMSGCSIFTSTMVSANLIYIARREVVSR